MLEPISEQLLKLLAESRLCTFRDLRKCRGIVRRLARDLPAFDSVWLDALVQARKLTPFQARILESSEPQRLKVGPCILVSQLGGGATGSTYLARPLVRDQLCVLKLVDGQTEELRDSAARIHALLRKVAGFSHPSLVVPSSSDILGNRLVLISRYIPGHHLKELLVRRGRYPADVVWEIGRQLLQGLAALDAHGCAHGDIRLANVRLQETGVAVLVDAGVQPALTLELTPHANLSPERYDGIAPELISTGRHFDSASDLYALGCLLWQLLAGRPPFPHGDPLAKLAAHRSRTIVDVRQWAPDTPELLAESILAMTTRDPEQRTAEATIRLRRWGPPRRSGRKRLSTFVADFAIPASGKPASRTVRSLAISAAAVLMLLGGWGASLGLRDEQHLPLLQIVSTMPGRMLQEAARLVPGVIATSDVESTAAKTGSVPSSAMASGLTPLPLPDANGLLELDSAGPYAADEVRVAGPLVIRGKPGVRPEIVIGRQWLKIQALHVHLENIHIRASTNAENPPKPLAAALVRIEAQKLTLRECSFQTHLADEIRAADSAGSAEGMAAEAPLAIAWTMSDPADPSAGMLTAENVVFRGKGAALAVAGIARRIELRNCLRLGPGPLLTLVPANQNQATSRETLLNLKVKLKSVTCRQSGALIRWQVPAVFSSKQSIQVQADDCVFDLQSQGAALFEFVGAAPNSAWLTRISMNGGGSLTNEGVQTAAWYNLSQTGWEALDAADLELEGLSASQFDFAGPFSRLPADSQILKSEGPQLSATPPGISAATLWIPPHSPAP